MNVGDIYFNDKHPIWCWDETELFGIAKKFSLVQLKEALTMFNKIIEVTDGYLKRMDDLEKQRSFDVATTFADDTIKKLFGEQAVDMVKEEYQRGVSRNKRAKEMVNILAIEISLWEVWNESQDNSNREPE